MDFNDVGEPRKAPRMNQEVKHDAVVQIRELIRACDSKGIQEVVSEMTTDELCYIWREFNSAERGTIKIMLED